MPSLFLTSRLPILPGMRKRKSRMAITDTSNQIIDNPRASWLPTQTAAPALGTRARSSICEEQKSDVECNPSKDVAQNTIRRASSSDFISIGKLSSGNIPSTPAPTENMMSPSDSRYFTLGPASPSRIARKASKIGSNFISDVKTGNVSLFGGIGRKSQQSQMTDSNRERMERLGEMGIVCTNSSAVDELGMGERFSCCGCGCDKEEKDVELGHYITPGGTKGIMKRTATTCPAIQAQPTGSNMGPKMVDPKPSVRFTLDLPPKLKLDLTLSGSNLDKDAQRSTEVEKAVQSSSSGWAEQTATALLDKSRDVEEYLMKDSEKRKDKRNSAETPENVERGGRATSNTRFLTDSTISTSRDAAAMSAEPQALHIDRISALDPIEPHLAVCRLEDLANVGSRLPSKMTPRRGSSGYASTRNPSVSQGSSVNSVDSRRSSIFDVRQQARADLPESLIKLRIEGEIEGVARTVSARKKVEGKGLKEIDEDNDCVCA